MSDKEDFTVDASTNNVLLRGELLHKNCYELMEAEILGGLMSATLRMR